MKKKELIKMLQSSQAPVSSTQLAKKLKISTRMIRQYINQINIHEEKYIQSSNKGYVLVKNPPEHLLKEAVNHQLTRIFYIVTAITDEDSAIDILGLSEELEVSVTTVENDLKRLQAILEDFDLIYARKNNIVKIKGTEPEKRKLYRSLLTTSSHGTLFEFEHYRQLFSVTDLEEIQSIILAAMTTSPFQIDDYSLINLSLHIGISLERIAIENEISASPRSTYFDQIDQEIVQIAHQIIQKLEVTYGVCINENERKELLFTLISRISPEELRDHEQSFDQLAISNQTFQFVKKLMKTIDFLFHLDLTDHLFLTQFALHIDKLLIRSENNLQQHNPLKNSIKNDYPILFDIAVFISYEIKNEFNVSISDEELTFLVLHLGIASNMKIFELNKTIFEVGLIYPEYYHSTEHIVTLLQNATLDKLNISVLPITQKTSLESFDFILSSVPVNDILPVPIVDIHIIPTSEDLEKILTLCNQLKKKKEFERLKNALSAFKVHVIETDIYLKDELEYIHYMGSKLLKEDIVTQEFIDAVIEREKVSSTYNGDHIAFPHSSGIRAQKNFLFVIKNQQKVNWSGHKVDLIVLFGVTRKDVFLNVYDTLVKYFPAYHQQLAAHLG